MGVHPKFGLNDEPGGREWHRQWLGLAARHANVQEVTDWSSMWNGFQRGHLSFPTSRLMDPAQCHAREGWHPEISLNAASGFQRPLE